ncbi:MAG: DUF2911 domain-containing protein [Gemmatimonadaceae bacterium]
MTRLAVILTACPLFIGLVPDGTGAQGIPFSQHGDVAQRVAYTDISISYNRPTARGRVIYGDSAIVKWDRIWHPGADSASRITFSRPVTFEGTALASGTYSLWTIPRQTGPWTVILNRRAAVFHTPYPGEASDVLRVEIAPERGGHMESLAYYFSAVARDSTVLRLHWGETIIPMRIRVSTEPPD